MGRAVRKWLHALAYAALFVVVAGLSAAWTVAFLVRTGAETDVPPLTGKSVPEARHAATGRGLSLVVEGSEFSDSGPRGYVVSQSLRPGSRVQTGRRLGVKISRGPRERLAPRVLGLEIRAAHALLKSAAIAFEDAARTCSDEWAGGTVAAQEPRPGERLEPERIKLLLSEGPCD